MKRIGLGVLAHVDMGKTTLSEQILLRCGAICKKGSVDSGTALISAISSSLLYAPEPKYAILLRRSKRLACPALCVSS